MTENTGLHTGLTAREFENHPDFDSWNDSHFIALVMIKQREAYKQKDESKRIWHEIY
jgi:hypothetical protein